MSAIIEEKYVEIYDPGDPSVGIENATWTISGDFFFEDKQEKEEFRQSLKEAFELVTDCPKVMFQTEIDAMEEF